MPRVGLAGIALLAAAVRAQDREVGEACPVFVLVEEAGRLLVRQESLAPGAVRVLESNPETGILDVILPPGPGGSGSLEEIGPGRTITIAHRDGTLAATTELPGGRKFERPPQSLDALASRDVRLSVLGAGGLRLRGEIQAYARFVPDAIVPFVDPFGGAVTPDAHQYLVFTRTAERPPARDPLLGETPLEFHGGHHFVEAQLPDGSTGSFLVDLGAGATLVTPPVLPEDAAIREMQRSMHTVEGVQHLAATLGGATGEFSVLGSATVPYVDLGGLFLEEIEAVVLEDLPQIGGRRLVGILGLDVLGQAERLAVEYPHPGRPEPLLCLGGEPSDAPPDAVLPFALAGNLFLCGEIDGKPVTWILDTGSATSILDETAARSLGLALGAARGSAAGLGGPGVALRQAVAPTLRLGELVREDVPLDVGALAVFEGYRGQQAVGLLGNSFLSTFGSIELDFTTGELRLLP